MRQSALLSRFALALFACIAAGAAQAGTVAEVASPDGRTRVEVDVSGEGRIAYRVARDGKPLIGTFPPQGYTVAAVSSGANHTLALLRPVGWTETLSGHSGLAEVWVCGSGKEGQLGPAYAAKRARQPKVFTRLDLAECLASLPEEDRTVKGRTMPLDLP